MNLKDMPIGGKKVITAEIKSYRSSKGEMISIADKVKVINKKGQEMEFEVFKILDDDIIALAGPKSHKKPYKFIIDLLKALL